MLDKHCQIIWAKYQAQLATEKARAGAAAAAAAKKAAEESLAAEKEKKTAEVVSRQAAQPQIEFMEVDSPIKGVYKNRVEIQKYSLNELMFVQIWNNGHRIYYRGQKSGDGKFHGSYRHTLDGIDCEYNFVFDPQTKSGKFEEAKGYFIPFSFL